MSDFFAEEHLEGDNKYECGKCDAYTNATKKMTVKEAPTNLIINLKKFDKFGTKIKSGVDYPNQFKLNDYFSKDGSKKSKSKTNNMTYELYAVINHEGKFSNCGHYNSYVKGYDQNWYICDDAKVKKINGNGPQSTDKAYILFYKLISGPTRENKVFERKASDASTNDVDSDTKSTRSTKPKSLSKINRKRIR